MRETIAEWALTASGLLTSLAVLALPLILVVTLGLAIFPKARPWGGVVLSVFSYLVGAATWFLGAAVTFTSFGWFGLILGLIVLGVGVVPLGIIGGFLYLDIGWVIIAMTVATFAFRGAGLWLAEQNWT